MKAQPSQTLSVEPAPDGTRYVGRSACLEFWQKLANSRDGAFADEDIVAE
jgi:hypothetical protein